MHPRRVLTTLLATALIVAALAGTALAKKDDVTQFGRGPWSHVDAGVTFTGSTTGSPFDGVTVGSVTADDGTLPPWSGCTPGSGTITTTSNRATFTVTFKGNLCSSVAPAGYLVLIGWYDVVEYTGSKGRRIADGRGHIDLRVLADGSAEWILLGDLF